MENRLFNDLQKHLYRPDLYQRSAAKFWDDPYIATQMLEAHLNPDTDAASRKPAFIAQCAKWLTTLPLPQNACLLDIGCGPGLYTKAFAEQGFRVTGLDFSENSIRYARAHDPMSEYIHANYLTMEIDSAYDIITLIYYDYGALIPTERHALLKRVHRALKPGGLFVFDILTPSWRNGKKDSVSWSNHPRGGFWSPKPHICLHANYYYDTTAEARQNVILTENDTHRYIIWDCYFTKQSLLAEALPAGFTALGFYHDVTGVPYTEDAQVMCAVMQKI